MLGLGETRQVVAAISRDNNASRSLLASNVATYYDDMSRHFAGLRDVLNPGTRIHYIVGNSTFNAVLPPRERIYASLLRKYGYRNAQVQL